jgi:hypothetical protein
VSALAAVNVAESIVAPLVGSAIFEASIGAVSPAQPAAASLPARKAPPPEQAASTTVSIDTPTARIGMSTVSSIIVSAGL